MGGRKAVHLCGGHAHFFERLQRCLIKPAARPRAPESTALGKCRERPLLRIVRDGCSDDRPAQIFERSAAEEHPRTRILRAQAFELRVRWPLAGCYRKEIAEQARTASVRDHSNCIRARIQRDGKPVARFIAPLHVESPLRRSTSGKRRGQRFDAEHNVVTESLIFLGELDPEQIGAAIEDATHYEPTPIGDFETLVADFATAPESFTFVDVGAGMGRVVMLASRIAFKQIVGVEVSRALCEVARDNLVRWRRKHSDLPCKDLRMSCGDASQMRMPAGDAVFYLFNPFGEATLTKLAHRIAVETTGRCFVVYHTPVHRGVFDTSAAFVLERDARCALIYRTN